MKSLWKNGLCVLAVVAATALVTSHVVGQDASLSEDDAMAQMMALGSPSEHHEKLKSMVGDWNLTLRWRMAEEAPWTEETMKATSKLIMGGRYLAEDVGGKMAMMPDHDFEGMSLMGYDNFKREFFSIWIDNTSTGYFLERGTANKSSKAITLTGENLDAMAGQMKDTKSVVTMIDKSSRKLEMFSSDANGKMWKSMEIDYRRK